MSTVPTTTTPAGDTSWAGPQRLATVSAVAGLGVFAACGILNYTMAHSGTESADAVKQFFVSYLVGYIFWFSLPVGGIALLLIHYLVRSSWGRLLNRPLEAATRTLPLLAVLFLPVLGSAFMGKLSPYWWAEPQAAHADGDHAKLTEVPAAGDTHEQQVAAAKAAVEKAVAHERHERATGTWGFLSPPMFAILAVVYFAVWFVLMGLLNGLSKKAAENPGQTDAILEKLNGVGAVGLVVHALILTAAATQWVMSLEAGWASTMFPVIFAVNQFLSAYALCLAVFMFYLVYRPEVAAVMRLKFQIDMGSLMLAFTLFWSYTSFSQMMLVWIGNLPEEIPFYLRRSMPTYGFWWWTSAGLIVFHFALPFLLLLFRDIKKHPHRLRLVAVYLLVVCAVDVMWWISPSIESHHLYLTVPMAVGSIVGIGGVWGLFFLYQLRQRSLLPVDQMYLLPEGHEGHDEHH